MSKEKTQDQTIPATTKNQFSKQEQTLIEKLRPITTSGNETTGEVAKSIRHNAATVQKLITLRLSKISSRAEKRAWEAAREHAVGLIDACDRGLKSGEFTGDNSFGNFVIKYMTWRGECLNLGILIPPEEPARTAQESLSAANAAAIDLDELRGNKTRPSPGAFVAQTRALYNVTPAHIQQAYVAAEEAFLETYADSSKVEKPMEQSGILADALRTLEVQSLLRPDEDQKNWLSVIFASFVATGYKLAVDDHREAHEAKNHMAAPLGWSLQDAPQVVKDMDKEILRGSHFYNDPVIKAVYLLALVTGTPVTEKDTPILWDCIQDYLKRKQGSGAAEQPAQTPAASAIRITEAEPETPKTAPVPAAESAPAPSTPEPSPAPGRHRAEKERPYLGGFAVGAAALVAAGFLVLASGLTLRAILGNAFALVFFGGCLVRFVDFMRSRHAAVKVAENGGVA